MFCLGVRVEYDNKAFVYSGDTNVCSALDTAMKGASLAVLDSAFTTKNHKETAPHLSAALCAGYAKRAGARTLLSHLPPNGDLIAIEKEAKSITDLCSLIETDIEYFI